MNENSFIFTFGGMEGTFFSSLLSKALKKEQYF